MTALSTLGVPLTQNTAPVHEFDCLYSHDLKKKKKIFQDGILSFHTFNRRIMVYDTSRNYIGDLHWQQKVDLQEGDDITLERGILVTVGELKSSAHTDLTPLFEKKDKPSQPQKTAPRPHRVALSSTVQSSVRTQSSQPKHKALSSIINKPAGSSYGKAVVSEKSPFELREEKENQIENPRPAKRAKTGAAAGEIRLNAERTFATAATERPSLWTRTARAQTQSIARPKQKTTLAAQSLIVPGEDVINLLSDNEPFSDVTLPDVSPMRVETEATVTRPKVKSRPIPARRATTPQKLVMTSSPPVSVGNKITAVGKFLGQSPVPVEKASKRPDIITQAIGEERGDTKPKTKPLRIPTGKVKKTLLCETYSQWKEAPRSFNRSRSSGTTSLRREEQVPAPVTLEIANTPALAVAGRRTTESPSGQDTENTMSVELTRMDQRFLARKPVSTESDMAERVASVQQSYNHPAAELDASSIEIVHSVRKGEKAAKHSDAEAMLPPKLRTRQRQSQPKSKRNAVATATASLSPVAEQSKDLGPWSKEAFDLFDWRPPDRNTNSTIEAG